MPSKQRQPETRALDADGNALVVGDSVRSTSSYSADGEIVDGVVMSRVGALITVKHASGSRLGQKWRSTARLWRKLS